MIKSAAVVGAGLTGCVVAERLAAKGVTVRMFDAAGRVGGLCADGYDGKGCRVQFGGPHILHTAHRDVWDYLSRFTEWVPYVHEGWACVDHTYVPLPLTQLSLDALAMPYAEAHALLYGDYTRKMWGEHAAEMEGDAVGRMPQETRNSLRYFRSSERYEGLPQHGYSEMMLRMLGTERVNVSLNCEVPPQQLDELCREHDAVVYCGRPDRAGFWAEWDPIPHRTLVQEWTHVVDPQHEAAGGVPVMNFPQADVGYLRVTDFRALLGQRHRLAAVLYEFPHNGTLDKYPTHPVCSEAGKALARRYADALRERLPNLHLAGRLGTSSYLDMGEAVKRALALAGRLLTEG